jgi:hypothetical protein
VHVFGELLDMPNVVEVSKYYSLLWIMVVKIWYIELETSKVRTKTFWGVLNCVKNVFDSALVLI